MACSHTPVSSTREEDICTVLQQQKFRCKLPCEHQQLPCCWPSCIRGSCRPARRHHGTPYWTPRCTRHRNQMLIAVTIIIWVVSSATSTRIASWTASDTATTRLRLAIRPVHSKPAIQRTKYGTIAQFVSQYKW